MTDLSVITVHEPTLDGDHERFAHIVLEGFKLEGDEFVSTGNSTVDAQVFGTPVEALCGKKWVPGRDPRKYPICPDCIRIAEDHGWKVPA